MEIKSFKSTEISLVPIKDRWYSVNNDVHISIQTDVGVIKVHINSGFIFDGRSGGKLIDFIVPNLGTQREIACWLVHDCFAHDIGFSFELTNDILYGMLRCCDYSWFRAGYVHTAVSLSDSWFGTTPTEQELKNISLIKYYWGP
jgi:hypothetical protein